MEERRTSLALQDTLKEPRFSKTAFLSCVDEEGFYKEGSVREVGVFIAINRLGSVNTVSQTFNVQFELQASWPCTKEDFTNYNKDPSTYVPSYLPRFVFPNGESVEKTLIENKHVGYRLSKTGGLDSWGNRQDLAIPFVNDCLYIVRGTFVEPMELQNFPVDCQDLTVVLELQESAERVILVPSHDIGQAVVNVATKYACIPEFIMHPPKVEFTTNVYDVHYPAVNLRLKLERRYKTQLYKVVVYLAVIALASLCAFSLDHIENVNDRLAILFTLMLTAVAFQFIVSLSIPNVPYLTLLDVYVLFTFSFIFLLAIEVSVVGYLEAPALLDGVLFLSSLLFYIIFNIYWTYHTIHVRELYELPKLYYTMKEYRLLDGTSEDDVDAFEIPHSGIVIDDHIKKKMSTFWEKYINEEEEEEQQKEKEDKTEE